jgi:phosphoglycolate phosphatase
MLNATAVFDLDGTLVDTAADLSNAINYTLSTLGLAAVPMERLRPIVSHGARAMLEEALTIRQGPMPPTEVNRLLDVLIEFYGKNIANESRAFPDVETVLPRLRAQGVRLAVCTNKREYLARRLLRTLRLEQLFDAVTGRDTLPVHKPDPGHLIGTVILADGDLGRCVMIGDSEIDISTAKSAGVPSIGVTFGYSRAPITQFEPDRVINHYRELEGVLTEIFPVRAKR